MAAAAVGALPGLCREVMAGAKHVSLDQAKINVFADSLTMQEIDSLTPPAPAPEESVASAQERVALILAQMSINFCYFPEPGAPRWYILDGLGLSGSLELLGSLWVF